MTTPLSNPHLTWNQGQVGVTPPVPPRDVTAGNGAPQPDPVQLRVTALHYTERLLSSVSAGHGDSPTTRVTVALRLASEVETWLRDGSPL